jgi:membrane-bound lytic murein transglycosylase A
MGEDSTDGQHSAADILTSLRFADLPGWADDDHGAALAAFRQGASVIADHPPKARAIPVDTDALTAALRVAAAIPSPLSPGVARRFFETRFQPFAIAGGFFTGYYEPEVAGSLTRSAAYPVPLHRRPDDLVEIDDGHPAAPGLPADFRFGRATPQGVAEYADRAAIMAGHLDGRGLELVWLADPVDAFFIHVQGAARIALADGRTMRVTYAAKTGHPYTAIGRVLIEQGALTRETATMQGIRAWLAAHEDAAAAVLAHNRSYIFFREAPVSDPALGPIAAAKAPLTAGRSLAVDRLLHTFHTPVWIETMLPGGEAFRRLTIAHDTGSAIVGPARGDIFFGSGATAGAIAGAMRSGGRFVVLLPRPA